MLYTQNPRPLLPAALGLSCGSLRRRGGGVLRSDRRSRRSVLVGTTRMDEKEYNMNSSYYGNHIGSSEGAKEANLTQLNPVGDTCDLMNCA